MAHQHPYRHRRSLLSLLIISTPTTKQQRSFSLIFSLSLFSTSTPAKPLIPPLRALAMASDDLTAAVTAAEDEKFGFKRSEMFKEKLASTVNAYDRHVFLCYKTPEAWPSRVEGFESDLLPKGEIIERHSRGQIGTSSDEAEEINDWELPNGEENKKIEEKPQENGNQINQEKGNQIENSENDESEEKQLKETRESCARKDALGKLSSLIGNWEQSDVLAAAVVVGAVATVAVAYSFYVRSC